MRNLLRLLWLALFLAGVLLAPLYAAARLPERPVRPHTLQLTLTSERPTLTIQEGVTTFAGDLPLVGEPGAPALPVVGRVVGIPARVAPSVTVRLGEPQALPRLNAPLAQVPLVGETAGQGTTLSTPDGWYPATPVRVGEPMTLRGRAVLNLAFTPVQLHLATGALRWYPSADVALSWDPALLPPEGVPGEDPSHEALLAATLDNYEAARGWSLAETAPPAPHQVASHYWMITVEGTGLFRVPYEQLASANVPLADPARLALFHGAGPTAEEQAIWLDMGADSTFGPGDALYLVNTRLPGRWSKQSAYRLELLPQGTGRRMVESPGTPNQGPLITSVSHELRFEEDTLYMQRESGARAGERWYWAQLSAYASSPGDPASRFETTFDLPHLTSASALARITAELGPLYARCHLARLTVNGRSVERQWSDLTGFGEPLDIAQSELRATGNTLRVEAETCGSTVIDFLMLNSFAATYQRALVVDGGTLAFDSDRSGAVTFQLSGLSSADVLALEVGMSGAARRIVGGTVTGSGPYTLALGRSDAAGERYLVTTRQQARPVESVLPRQDPGLRSDLSPTEYLLITHPDFAAALQPLVEHRSAQYSLRVVTTTDIYNEFGAGVMDPAAIREFIKFAYQNWRASPTAPPSLAYILLVGDATYDPFDIRGTGYQTWLPPMLVYKDDYLGEVPSDNAFVAALDPGDAESDVLPDAYIGRLPANSPEEAAAMAEKIVRYERAPAVGEWRRSVLFVADNPDSAGDFHALSERLLPFPERMQVTRAYLPDGSSRESLKIRDSIKTALNRGQLILQYIGHADRAQWANAPGLWSLRRTDPAQLPSDLDLLIPTQKLPFSLPWSCWEGYFIEPGLDAMSEEMLRLPDRGIIGSLAPTGLDVATGHDLMAEGFYDALFARDAVAPITQSGPLADAAKMRVYQSAYERLFYTYMLYGDPATTLNIDPCVFDGNAACSEGGTLFLPAVRRP